MKIKNAFIVLSLLLAVPFAVGEKKEEKKSLLTAELVVGTGIEDRQPVGEGDKFTTDVESLFAWTRIKGATETTEVKHIWYYKGDEVISVTLPIKSSYYRTWSRKTLQGKRGKWKVEVRDAQGLLIASQEFVVKKPRK